MKLLQTMLALQEREGWLSDETLKQLAKETGEPLYRLEGLRSFYPVFQEEPGARHVVEVCRDVVCRMQGAPAFRETLLQELKQDPDVEVREVSCLGRCEQAPVALVDHHHAASNATEVKLALSGHPREHKVMQAVDAATDPYQTADAHYGVFKKLRDGAADSGRDNVIDELKASGLRGMGGAGFPTGMKWAFTRGAEGGPKQLVCNADESEPGTFKDRCIMETLPHLMIEGMIIGGWVIEAERGIVYLRHEYGEAAEIMRHELIRARELGVLGPDAFGPGKPFDMEVFISPGGYILGEETALLEALEDKRGEPRNKPPFPTNFGLNGLPTLMNNVETFAAVPMILQNGGEWWQSQGVNDCPGLKYMAVSGDVAEPGVYCVPMGTTVADLISRAGGVADGEQLLAFSPGGASTRFLPADKADTSLDFDAMQKAGSALGSGAFVAVAEGRDLLDLATAQARFFRNESCGKCVPCRVGSSKAVAMLEDALKGDIEDGLAGLLHELDDTLAQTSICGLGQVALSPVTGVMEMFPEVAQRLGRKEDA